MWSDSNYYTWKIETDEFQPEGLTREIELQIPYGLDRKLEFIINDSSGFVKVDDGENVEVLDLYNKDKSSIKINLSSTSRNTIYAVKLYVFTLWLFIFCVFLKLFQLKIENGLTFFDKLELSTRKLAMNTIFHPSRGRAIDSGYTYYQSSLVLLLSFMIVIKCHKIFFVFVDNLSEQAKKR